MRSVISDLIDPFLVGSHPEARGVVPPSRSIMPALALTGLSLATAACSAPSTKTPEVATAPTPIPLVKINDGLYQQGNRVWKEQKDGSFKVYENGIEIIGSNVSIPGATPAVKVEPSNTPKSEQVRNNTAETSSTLTELQRMGIEIDLDGLPAEWPKTPEAAAALIAAGSNSVKPENLVPVVWSDAAGRKHWSGEFMGEMWPVNEGKGVHYDKARGIHVNAQGKAIIDIQQIFDFSQKPTLANVRLNVPFAALYAGRGFETRDGLPQYTGYFAGSKGAEVRQIEQLTILQPEFDRGCDPRDYATAAITRGARTSVREFKDNARVRDGFDEGGVHKFQQVQWFNPETGRFQEVQGRGVAEMAKQGIAMPFIDKMPAGFPLSAKEMSDRIGGNEDKWVFDPEGIWNYEAWDFIPGVRYVPRVGHFDQQGHILVGANRVAYGNPGCIFDYSKSVNPDLMFSSMNGPGSLPASLFVRVGGDVTDTKHPQSWYTSGHGNITVDPHISTLSKAEQAKLVIVDQDACPPYEGADMLTRFNMGLGQDEKRNHPGFKVMVWKNNGFIEVK